MREATVPDPVKLCCGSRQSKHSGPVCPDGKIMCCLCFARFTPTPETQWDVCIPCAAEESRLQ